MDATVFQAIVQDAIYPAALVLVSGAASSAVTAAALGYAKDIRESVAKWRRKGKQCEDRELAKLIGLALEETLVQIALNEFRDSPNVRALKRMAREAPAFLRKARLHLEDSVPLVLESWAASQKQAPAVSEEHWRRVIHALVVRCRVTIDDRQQERIAGFIGERFPKAVAMLLKGAKAGGPRAQVMLAMQTRMLTELRALRKQSGVPVADIEALEKSLAEEITGYIKKLSYDGLQQHEELLSVLGEIDDKLAGVARECRKAIETAIQEGEQRQLQPSFNRLKESGERGLQRLQYRERFTEIVGREEELLDLHLFANSEEVFQAWSVVGPGGTGKSRLALEWVDGLNDDGWDAGFLRRIPDVRRRGSWLGQAEVHSLWCPSKPTAIVVDYSMELTADVDSFIEAMLDRAQHGSLQAPVRLLLLDRDFAGRSWRESCHGSERFPQAWYRSRFPQEEIGSAAAAIQKPRLVESQIERIRSLTLAPLEESHRFELLKLALEKLKVSANKVDSWLSNAEFSAHVNRLTDNGRPLYVLAVAILLAEKGPEGLSQLGQAEMFDFVLGHEFEYWQQVAKQKEIHLDHLKCAVGFTTLCRGLSTDKLREAIGDVIKLQGMTLDGRQLTKAAEATVLVLGAEGGKLAPLTPDPIAERFLKNGGNEEPPSDAKQPVFDLKRWLPVAIRCDPAGLGSTLTLLIQGDPANEDVHQLLHGAFGVAQEADESRQSDFAVALLPSLIPLALSAPIVAKRAYASIGRLFADEDARRPSVVLMTVLGQLCYHLGADARLEELDHWLGRFEEVADSAKGGMETALLQATVAVNAINYYGEHQKWDELEVWGKRLPDAAAKFPGDHEMWLREAQGSFNAINHYGEHEKWDELEAWRKRLSAAVSKFPEDREIWLVEAKGAVNAISDYGKHAMWDELEAWGKRLDDAASKFPEDPEIWLEKAKGAVNAINCYGEHAKWDELEAWGKRLDDAASKFPEDREIRLEEAKGAFNAISDYGKHAMWDELEAWGKRLSDGASKFPEGRQIWLAEAKGAFNAVSDYGEHAMWDELEAWGKRLSHAASKFPEDPEIWLEEAKGSVNAIGRYGEHAKRDELEAWGRRLSHAAAKFPEDSEIRLREAKGAFNAISHYGEHAMWDELEAWGKRLSHAAAKFPEDRAIWFEEASGAVNAINCYGEHARYTDVDRWASRLAGALAHAAYDSHVCAVAGRVLASAYVKSKSSAVLHALLRVANVAPWVKPWPGEEAPPLLRAALQLAEEAAPSSPEASELLASIKRDLAAREEIAKIENPAPTMLWPYRRFLDNWGKNLWPLLMKRGETAWIDEAMQDPWTSPEEVELLKKMKA